MTQYFFDTYALVELLKANPNYEAFKKCGIATTKLNLLELHYHLRRELGREAADAYFEQFLPYCLEITDSLFKEASELKFNFRSRNLSYIDCIGYTLAQMIGIPFLTGDKQFEDLPNVKFVK